MIKMRKAQIDDLDFLAHIDLKVDGYSSVDEFNMKQEEKLDHWNKISEYVIDPDKGTFILEDTENNEKIGIVMYRISNRDSTHLVYSAYRELDRSLFQADGRFLEVFQLWVHTEYRRRGLATQLKRKLDEEARRHHVNLIYTHTLEVNKHVVELNIKLGYLEVRRGPIWDNLIRVSLIKHLNLEIKSY
jgi:ribosomal protein S18 acetylase RimI-like enzyme